MKTIQKLLPALTVFAALMAAQAPVQAQVRYSYNATGNEVTDIKTGLVWRRCAEGASWNGTACIGNSLSFTHEAALQRAKAQQGTAGWRLPNAKELASLLDRTQASPAINSQAFPSTVLAPFWSATPYAAASPAAIGVNFTQGNIAAAVRSDAYKVRLVR
jgi:Protein of unknown function (DUF1566)